MIYILLINATSAENTSEMRASEDKVIIVGDPMKRYL